jgi:hypothetical protein
VERTWLQIGGETTAYNINTKTISAQSSVQNGAPISNVGHVNVSMFVVVSGTITGGTVLLQVSPDSVSWATVATRTLSAAGTTVDSVVGSFKFLRAAISVALTGGGVCDIWVSATPSGIGNDSGYSP